MLFVSVFLLKLFFILVNSLWHFIETPSIPICGGIHSLPKVDMWKARKTLRVYLPSICWRTVPVWSIFRQICEVKTAGKFLLHFFGGWTCCFPSWKFKDLCCFFAPVNRPDGRRAKKQFTYVVNIKSDSTTRWMKSENERLDNFKSTFMQ